MEHRPLGTTGFEVSEIGYGAWGIGGSQWGGADDDESIEALNRATLARQLLLERAELDPVAAIERIGGLQAQEPRPAFEALWTRLRDFDRAALHRALHDRSVVRGTTLRALEVGKLLATSFHPEVTGEKRVHELFIRMIRGEA